MCVHACICVCMRVCVCVCMCVWPDGRITYLFGTSLSIQSVNDL